MNQNISAAETLFSAAHPDIKKITNISALILSLLFCAVGLCLLFFSSKVEDSSSASGPVLLVGGIAFLVAGGIRLMIRKRSLIYVPTGSLVKKGSCFFEGKGDNDSNKNFYKTFQGLVEDKTFDGKAEVLPKKDGGVRMDYMVSQDGNFAAVQLLKYVPYAYEPASSVLHYTGEEASAFVNALRVGRF